MQHIQSNGWTLKYELFGTVCGPVSLRDVIMMPDGRDLLVTGGRAPCRVNDAGGVRIADKATFGAMEARPGALGLVWQNDMSGGIAA